MPTHVLNITTESTSLLQSFCHPTLDSTIITIIAAICEQRDYAKVFYLLF